MTMTQIKRLPEKYRPLFLGLLLLSFFSGKGQTYNPATCCTVSNKAYGAAQAVSTDGRSWFYDATNFVMRDYNGTSEVFSYLNLAKYRSGHFPVFVHTGGTLQANGVWLGGGTLVYWFKDSTGNANLVRWYTDSTGVSGGPFYAIANNLSEGNAGLIKGNLALDLVNNTSDATKWAATATLTNKAISGSTNTLTNIPNSALVNNTIGLTLDTLGTAPAVTTTPAALGASLKLSAPWGNGTNSGFIKNTDWTNHNNKVDSTSLAATLDSVFDWHNSSKTFRYKIPPGAGAVLSVSNADATMVFSPTTGNVLGRVNTASTFNWTNLHTFTAAPTISSLISNGGVLYTNGSGSIQQATAGTSSQILQGGTAPAFFTPTITTLNTWAGFNILSSALGSTHIFVGNGSNIATDVAMTGDVGINNTGFTTIAANAVTNAKAAQMPANTLKGNNTGSLANQLDLTVPQVTALLGLDANYFKQGGNSFGATAILGTKDNNPLDFYTNNAVRGRITAGGNWGINTTNPLSMAELTNNAIGTSQNSSYGLALRNYTAATNVLSQFSPPLVFRGNNWNVGGAASYPYEVRMYVGGVSGQGNFTIDASINGGAAANVMNIVTDNGNVMFQGQVNTANSFSTSIGYITGLVQYYAESNDAAIFANSGNNPSALKVYNSRDVTGTNTEFYRLGYTKNANILTLSSEKAGTGVVRPIQVSASGSPDISVFTNGNVAVGSGTDGLNGKLQVSGNVTLYHLAGVSTAPTIAAGTGAGTGPTVSISGTDLSGTISVTTGTTPAASAVIATVTFNTAFATAPRKIVGPTNAAAIALAGNNSVPSTTTTTLVLTSQTALAASTTYTWDYIVTQ